MKIGDAVLHTKYGVGTIKSVEQRLYNGVNRDYYVIPKPSMASTLFLPVDTADEEGLRPVSTTDQLEQAVSILSGEADETSLFTNGHVISWGDPIDLACVVRSCAVPPYPRVAPPNQVKHARFLLGEELSSVLGLTEERIYALVEKPKKK